MKQIHRSLQRYQDRSRWPQASGARVQILLPEEGQIFFPHWRILRECLNAVWEAQLSWYERICCYLSIMKQWQGQGTEIFLIKDLISYFIMTTRPVKKTHITILPSWDSDNHPKFPNSDRNF